MYRRTTVICPVDGLLFWKLSGSEALSHPFSLDVTLLGRESRPESKALLGQPLTLAIPLQHGTGTRYLNGKITRVLNGAQEIDGKRYTTHILTIESDLWPMKRDRNQRIFQENTVPQIVKTLLGEYQVNVEDRLTGRYRTWEYCVQYQESSLDFISRLMELEGISYFFLHENGSHTLVLTDSGDLYKPFSGYEVIPYHQTASGGVTSEEGITQWQPEAQVTPGLYSLDDYDFRQPNAWLLKAQQNPASPQPGGIDVYDWPGRYVRHSEGENYARIRQQRWAVEHKQAHGLGTATGLCPGCTFTLINAPEPDDNGDWLVTKVAYQLEENTYASGGGVTKHQLDFNVLPAGVVFRPAQTTPWPRTFGPQTARVVGPAGKSIWTDRFGRVKVKFHWDREAKGDDTSSCWIRVSSAWAGQGYGGIQIPRVNDEVVVDFINGDPDRPIITGRVYNEANMPPWALPANATQMGFYSRTKDGAPDQANAFRLEDKAGEEEVFIRAQKDMNTLVLNDRTTDVGNNHSESVCGNQTIEIQKNQNQTIHGDQTESIDGNQTQTTTGNQTQTIHGSQVETIDGEQTQTTHGSQSETIDGNQTLLIQQNQVETVAFAKAETIGLAKAESIGAAKMLTIGAAYQISVGALMNTSVGANQSSQIAGSKHLLTGKHYSQRISGNKVTRVEKNNTIKTGQHIKFQAGESFTIVCGKSRLVLDKSGKITLNGKELALTTTGKQSLKAGGDIKLKGKKIHEN